MQKKVILDTSVIIAHPKLLGLHLENTEFIIPYDVILELSQLTDRKEERSPWFDIAEKAEQDGTVRIINSQEPKYENITHGILVGGMSKPDWRILGIAMSLVKEGYEVSIATLDNDLRMAARGEGIPVLTKREIVKLEESFVEKAVEGDRFRILFDILASVLFDSIPFGRQIKRLINFDNEIVFKTIQQSISSFEWKERGRLVVGIVIGSALTVLAFYLYRIRASIFSTFNVWGSMVFVVVFGIVLFLFRERSRLAYGVFEFLVGVYSIYLLLHSLDFNYDKIESGVDFGVKIFGGLYIMVRGQDNIVKSQKGKKFGVWLASYKIGL